MNKKEFVREYILTRTSHKRKIEELLTEAELVWTRTEQYQ
jgi:hypothetical protein